MYWAFPPQASVVAECLSVLLVGSIDLDPNSFGQRVKEVTDIAGAWNPRSRIDVYVNTCLVQDPHCLKAVGY